MDKQAILKAIRKEQHRLGMTHRQCGELIGYKFPINQWSSLFNPNKVPAWGKIDRVCKSLGLELEVRVKQECLVRLDMGKGKHVSLCDGGESGNLDEWKYCPRCGREMADHNTYLLATKDFKK